MSEHSSDPGPQRDELLRSFLAIGEVACPVCSYELKGVTSTRCPECGAMLELRIGSADHRLGAWTTSVIGVSMILGLPALYLVYGIVAIVVSAYSRRSIGFAVPIFVVPAVAMTPAAVHLVLLIRGRRRFWRWSKRAQWAITIISLPVTIALVIATGAVMSYLAMNWI